MDHDGGHPFGFIILVVDFLVYLHMSTFYSPDHAFTIYHRMKLLTTVSVWCLV